MAALSSPCSVRDDSREPDGFKLSLISKKGSTACSAARARVDQLFFLQVALQRRVPAVTKSHRYSLAPPAGATAHSWLEIFMETTMKLFKPIAIGILAAGAGIWAAPVSALGEAAQPLQAVRDGQHDFDFNFGTWKTHIKRVLDPFSASSKSIELERHGHRPKSLGWPRSAGRDRDRRPEWTLGRPDAVSLQSGRASMESVLRQQPARCSRTTADRILQERPRRTVRLRYVQ